MTINELTAAECSEFLSRVSLGRLACSLDDQPYVVPIFLAHDAGYLHALSTVGQKIKWMRKNPKVCVQVDEIQSQSQWTSVVVNGQYQELVEPRYSSELAHARKLLEKHLRWWENAMAERQLKMPDSLIAPLFFRVHVESMTGLRAD